MLGLLIGALCIGLAPIFTKLAVAAGVSPIAAGFWRMFVGCFFFSTVGSLNEGKAYPVAVGRLFSSSLLLSVGAGLVFALDLAAWHTSFEYTSVANSTIIANLSSILVPAVGVLWLGERPHWSLYFGGMVAISGVAVLSLNGTAAAAAASQHSSLFGDSLAFLTAFFYTTYMFFTKILGRQHSPLVLMSATSGFSAIFLLALSLAWDLAIVPSNPIGWIWILGLGTISQGLGQGLVARSLIKLPLSLSALLLLSAPLGSAFFGVVILHQTLSTGQMFGIAITLFGIGIVARYR